MNNRRHTLLLLCALLGACADRGSPARPAARDSAGVQIIATETAAWGEQDGWRITDAPALTIGAEEGDTLYLLSRVVGAIRLDDGTIVVADGGSNQLRFFNASGRFVRAVGREGKGPGEFEYLRNLKRCGANAVYAFDLNWQTKIYSVQGELQREMTLLDPGSGRTPYALACSRDGRFVITGWGAQTLTPTIGFYRATAPVSLLDENGQLIVQLGEFPSSERIGTERGSRPHPFGRSTSVEIGSDALFVGTAETLEVHKYSLLGDPDVASKAASAKLVGVIRGPAQDLEIRPEHLEAYRAQRLANVSAEQRPELERQLRDMPLPPAFPAYTELKLDSEGNLWLRRFLRPDESAPRWTVFDREGVMLGDVDVPADWTITEIGRDYILGIHRDELGVERVLLYGLQKPARD